jgi:hypothetical protein
MLKTFDFILIVCFNFSFLEHESLFFNQISLSFLVNYVHVHLRYVVSFSFVSFYIYLFLFKEFVARNLEVEQP